MRTRALLCLLVLAAPGAAAFSGPPMRRVRTHGNLHCFPVDEAAMPPRRPAYSASYDRSEMDILRSRVLRLETILRDICGAVVHSDDIALLEREAAGVGKIFRDGSFTESRKPLFARVAIQSVLNKHGIVAAPPMHSWAREMPEMSE